MRIIIIGSLIAGAVAASFIIGAAAGYLFTYPARQRLQQAKADLLQRVDDLTKQIAGASNMVGNMRNEHHAVLNLATMLANANTQLISRMTTQHWRGQSEDKPDRYVIDGPLSDLAAQAQTPTYQGTPGTTACLTCGSVLATPDNRIPGAWLLQHTGHQININLVQHQPVEEAFKEGDIIDG